MSVNTPESLATGDSTANDECLPPVQKDWHREEIICAVRMTGSTLTSLSRDHGLADGTLANALNRPWPKGELIIAAAIGVDAENIWPSRFSARRERERKKRRDKRRG